MALFIKGSAIELEKGLMSLRVSTPLFAIAFAFLMSSAAVAQQKRVHGHASPSLSAATTTTIWHPSGRMTWQWQLTTPVDQTVNVPVYDIDMFDNDASVVSALHLAGRKAICYIDFGTWENWRPDASKFPASVKGAQNGWPGEVWLDIRQLSILEPIMGARLDLCKAKGFDAVEPDNIDGYENGSGFPLGYQDQLTYNKWIATAAHARGLSVGLKNDLDQVPDLISSFDWALDEQCHQYDECDALAPFVTAGKAVFEVEYSGNTTQFCPGMDALDFNSMKKRLSLDSWRQACP
jgi:hypothetical protein